MSSRPARLSRELRIVPGVVAAEECGYVREPFPLQFKRHTGTRSFFRSRTVCYDQFLTGEFVQACVI